MDGVIEDIAAVGVDHVDRHLAAAVVHLVAHGSVAVNLGIAQHEVITFPLDGIAPARDVFVRAHLERHPVGTQCPEAVTNPGKYPGGTVGGRRQRPAPCVAPVAAAEAAEPEEEPKTESVAEPEEKPAAEPEVKAA